MSTLSGQNSFSSIPSNNLAASLRLALPSSLERTALEQGLLEISILSVYDLPFSEHPKAISLSTCGTTVTSGPPVARHKDNNSFRFSATPTLTSSTISTANTSKHELQLAAPLPELYKANLTIRVLYDDNPSQTLQAEYSLHELKIHELTWLILTLGAPGAPPSTTSTTSPTNADDDVQPTIRVKLQLTGPYRPEIAALVAVSKAWLELMDHVESNVQQIVQRLPTMPDKKYILVPAVPLVTVVVVATPVIAGVLVVGLPFFLPILVLAAAVGASLVGAGGFLYASTKGGRSHVGGVFGPYLEGMVSSRAGQKLVYNTGPRPTPVSIARQILPTTMWSKLMVCLLLDLIGSSSYLLPVLGEGFDLAWAPLQTIFIMAMYDSVAPNLKYLSFAEEILPFTDIVPSATIGWAVEFGPQLINTTLQHAPPEITSLTSTPVPSASR
jgi:hypothetical protein